VIYSSYTKFHQRYMRILAIEFASWFWGLRPACVQVASSPKPRVLPVASCASYFFLTSPPQETIRTKSAIGTVTRIYGAGVGKNQDADLSRSNEGATP
jgi:hypothetical protein